MIIQRTKDQVLAIRQEDHAAFAGFMLEHWSDHRFSREPNRARIIRATSEHDNGWREYDNAPRLNGRTGLPVDFMHVNAEEAYDVWNRGVRRYLDEEPYVALLIVHHAYSLHEHAHDREGVWKRFFTEFARLRGELRDQLGMTHNQVEHAYSFLRMMDWFSLVYCMHPDLGSEAPEKYAGYTFKREGAEYLFRPYPFDNKELEYRLPVYPLNPEGYRSTEELAEAMQTPEYVEILINPLERKRR